MSDEIECQESSGNVFADLGLPDPDLLLAKADLAIQIAAIIEERRWTQAQAAAVLGLDQPKVSALVRGRLRDFSLERLMMLLTRLGQDVEITARPSARHEAVGHLRIHDAHKMAAASHAPGEPVRFD